MNHEAIESVDFSEARMSHIRGVLMISIALCLALQAVLAFALEVNWDEFLYLSQIYDFQRGEWGSALQSLHVHLLGWLTLVPGDEIDQILVGRFVMLAFLAGTCCLIYALARTFFSPLASIIAALAFASAGPVLIHGSSFRADPIAACFTMLSLVVMARSQESKSRMLLAGLSGAVAAMITIKVVLYTPAFAGIAVSRLCENGHRRRLWWWLAGIALSGAIVFAALYGLQLALVLKSSTGGSRDLLNNAAQTTLLGAGVLPRRAEIIRAAVLSPAQSVLLLAGVIGLATGLVRGNRKEKCRLVAIGGCGGTLLCLLFYRNAFPYFFAFILPPAMLLIAWVIDWSALLKRPLWLAILCAAFLIPAIMIFRAWSGRDLPPQRQVVAAVHEIFPDPVPMIDHSHMIGSFPKRGFFMSTWGMTRYRAGPPIFAGILQREPVPLLLLDSPRLAEAVGVISAMRSPDRLHDKDRAVLGQNYIPHWGPIWVAGKTLDPAGRAGQFNILIPGTYSLEGPELVIDGKLVPNGGIVQLARGRHSFKTETQTPRILRWGNHLHRPAGPEPKGPLFVGF